MSLDCKKQRKELPNTLMGSGLLVIFLAIYSLVGHGTNYDRIPAIISDIIFDLNIQIAFFGILLFIIGLSLRNRRISILQNIQPHGIAKTGNIIIIIISFMFAISIISIPLLHESSDVDKSLDVDKSKDWIVVIETVQNYQGNDGTGSTLIEVISIIVQVSYPKEDIVNHPLTKMSWDALPNVRTGNGIYDVYFDFKTYDQQEEFHFLFDTNTGNVWAGNSVGSDILKILDADIDS